VICIAPTFDKYSLHAVKHIGSDLELWQYHRYENGILELEEIFRSTESSATKVSQSSKKGPALEESKDARATDYTFESHEAKADEDTKLLLGALVDNIMALDSAVAEVPLKFYIAYKLAKNFACVEVHKKKVVAFLNLSHSPTMPSLARDVSNVGHYGTGKLEVTVKSQEDLAPAFDLIRASYLASGGN
jgi:predicted transport protein